MNTELPGLPSNPGAGVTSQRRLGEVDALRGIAALAVVLFHYTTRYDDLYGHSADPVVAVPWGHYGVNLFFMISGFVIFMTLERTRTAPDFVVSRFSRLFPAYWAAIAVTSVVVALLGLPGREVPLAATAANLGMLHNLFEVAHVDPVYWTLEVEMLFYGLALLTLRLGWLPRVHLLFAALFLARLLYFWCSRYAQVELPALPYRLLILHHIPWFGAGVMIHRLVTHGDSVRRDLAMLCAAIAVIVIAEGYTRGAIMLMFTALLYGAARGILPLDRRWLVWLGAVSYTWYLVHQNVGYALMRQVAAVGVDVHLTILFALCLSLAIAYGLTVLVERPAMAWLRRRRQTSALTRKNASNISTDHNATL